MAEPVTVICMKWRDRYAAHYVNRLYAGVRRNVQRPLRFVCFTDDPDDLDPGIEALPLPATPLPAAYQWTPWRKLAVWQADLAGLTGDVLFLDIDLIVTGPLDPLFDHAPGAYCVIENWTQPGEGIGNTSVFRFPAGKYTQVFDQFAADPNAVLSEHRIEQQYISTIIPEQTFWPSGWCVSFKHNLVPRFPRNWQDAPTLPDSAKIVVFTGRPDIDEAIRGEWPAPWFKRHYKHSRPAPWIADHWREEEISMTVDAANDQRANPTPMDENRPPLSCYIRTKNEARLIGEVVTAALTVAREVIVVDSGSTDGTPDLAAEAGAIVHHVEWRGTGKQKRAGEDLCQYPWRLDLDADEVVSDELTQALKDMFGSAEPSAPVYSIRMITAPPIGEPWVKVDSDWRYKLYDSRVLRMPDHAAWDQLDIPAETERGKINAPLIHHSFTDIGFLLRKQERNMTQRAIAVPQKSKWLLGIRIIFGMPVYFLKRYLFKGLFLKGVYGFSFAMTIAVGRWLKDVKMWERHHFEGQDR